MLSGKQIFFQESKNCSGGGPNFVKYLLVNLLTGLLVKFLVCYVQRPLFMRDVKYPVCGYASYQGIEFPDLWSEGLSRRTDALGV